MEKYGSFTVNALKSELRRRGARLSGKKEDLIKRLVDYDRNNNFVPEPMENEDDGEDEIYFPPDGDLRTVSNSTSTPDFCVLNILSYFDSSDTDGHTMRSAVHRKSYTMMKEDFLRAVVTKEEQGKYYFRAQVNSEYTKNMTYFVKVIVEKDGEISYSNCECVAGKGRKSVCKHVGAFCYCLLHFVDKREWRVTRTCTELSQKWHLPKKIKMDISPKKSETVTYEVLDYLHQSKKKRIPHCYDPRTIADRNKPNYTDFVRNKIIAYQLEKKVQLGISGTFGPANLKALELDHDYGKVGVFTLMIQNWIETLVSRSTEIEKATWKQAACKEWHDTRTYFVTASNAGTVVNMTERRNIDALVKTMIDPPKLNTPAIKWGRDHEKKALAEYERRSYNKVQPCGLFISKSHPFVAGTPDGLIRKATVLEIKCPYSIRNDVINSENLDYLAVENGNLVLNPKSNYYIQAQIEMFVTEREFCDFVVWTTKYFKNVSVTRDDNLIYNVILPKLSNFQEKYLIPALAKKSFPTCDD